MVRLLIFHSCTKQDKRDKKKDKRDKKKDKVSSSFERIGNKDDCKRGREILCLTNNDNLTTTTT